MDQSLLTNPIVGGNYYHILKKSEVNLFYSQANYQYFMRRYAYYLNDISETIAFCLLPNHFHILFRAPEIITIKGEYIDHPSDIGHFISDGIRKFFANYSNFIMKQEGLIDPPLDANFFRVQIDEDTQLKELLVFIHKNGTYHNVNDDYSTYPNSSFQNYFSNHKSLIGKETAFSLFDSREQFIELHQTIDLSDIQDNIFLE